MAKDLPFFKFFCSEWNDGDITLEDYNIQGLFINVCSYYWSKECNVSKKLLYKKFKHDKNDIDYLMSERFIKIKNDNLSIGFLDEQFSEVESNSKSRSLAGKKSAKLKKLRKQIDKLLIDLSQNYGLNLTQLQQEFNTTSTDVDFLLQQISTIKIREDKIRGENILKSNNKKDNLKIENNISENKNTYSEKTFLENWSKLRMAYLKQPTFIPKLNFTEKKDLTEALKDHSKEDVNNALRCFFNQKTKNIPSMYLRPTHFLANVNKYFNAFLSGEVEIYGKENKTSKISL